eukprot:9201675-Ditylum_brightwellii.AAC.1
MILIFRDGDISSWSVFVPVHVPVTPAGVSVGGFLPFLCSLLPGVMILGKMPSIIITAPSATNGTEPDGILFIMLCPAMENILLCPRLTPPPPHPRPTY